MFLIAKKVLSNIIKKYFINNSIKDLIYQSFRINLLKIKCNLDKKSRSFEKSKRGRFVLYERSLRPIATTIIIVPLILIEHWYEQIIRYINLNYLSDNNSNNQSFNQSNNSNQLNDSYNLLNVNDKLRTDGHGIVYIDGLGDIMDIQAPLPKLVINNSIQMNAKNNNNSELNSENVSNYLFFITTFERCSLLQQKKLILLNESQSESNNIYENDSQTLQNTQTEQNISINNYNDKELSIILNNRWLRLIVDEGHSLGHTFNQTTKTQQTNNHSNNDEITIKLANDFICEISAERRWVMSGTPVTGTNTTDALWQLNKLLIFLKHNIYGLNNTNNNQLNDLNNIINPKNTKNSTKLKNTNTLINNKWYNNIIKPFIKQNVFAYNILINLLKSIIIRHQKKDLQLFEPIKSLVVVDRIRDASHPDEESSRHIDRGLAMYIANYMYQKRIDWKQSLRQSFSMACVPLRRPKAIVFSQEIHDLQVTISLEITVKIALITQNNH